MAEQEDPQQKHREEGKHSTTSSLYIDMIENVKFYTQAIIINTDLDKHPLTN